MIILTLCVSDYAVGIGLVLMDISASVTFSTPTEQVDNEMSKEFGVLSLSLFS